MKSMHKHQAAKNEKKKFDEETEKRKREWERYF